MINSVDTYIRSSPDLKSTLSVHVTSRVAAGQCARHNALIHLMKSPTACTKVLCRCVLIDVITVDSSGLILVLYCVNAVVFLNISVSGN